MLRDSCNKVFYDHNTSAGAHESVLEHLAFTKAIVTPLKKTHFSSRKTSKVVKMALLLQSVFGSITQKGSNPNGNVQLSVAYLEPLATYPYLPLKCT